nr:hypothetical protein Iba_chr02bCG11180 [Ipomoea batatas]
MRLYLTMASFDSTKPQSERRRMVVLTLLLQSLPPQNPSPKSYSPFAPRLMVDAVMCGAWQVLGTGQWPAIPDAELSPCKIVGKCLRGEQTCPKPAIPRGNMFHLIPSADAIMSGFWGEKENEADAMK